MGRCFEIERSSGLYILFGLKQNVRYMLTVGESRPAAAARAARAFYAGYKPDLDWGSWNVGAGDNKRREKWMEAQPVADGYARNYVDVQAATCPAPFDKKSKFEDSQLGLFKDFAMSTLGPNGRDESRFSRRSRQHTIDRWATRRSSTIFRSPSC